MKFKFSFLVLFIAMFSYNGLFANQPVKVQALLEMATPPSNKQQKMEALLTARKWTCLEVSKKKLTKKLDFDIGNIIGFSIDKKFSFKNNNYSYSNGTWKLDDKYLYFFYNASDGTNKTEVTKFKILTLSETTLILKRTEKPKGKLTFK